MFDLAVVGVVLDPDKLKHRFGGLGGEVRVGVSLLYSRSQQGEYLLLERFRFIRIGDCKHVCTRVC